MSVRVAINGFGRIGRLVFRLAQQHAAIQIVAINDLVSVDNLAYLLKFDSTHGKFEGSIEIEENALIVNQVRINVFSERKPENLPWKELRVDYVVESSGIFREVESVSAHLRAGAKRVIVSAPAKDEMPTFVYGVNHQKYNPKSDFVISNASCTTNCLAPLAKVVLDNFGIEEALMTTVHAVTASQPTVDGASDKDYRGGRGAGQNIIPATTGAAKAVGLCLPELKGKLTGMAFRIPVPDVSVVDLTVRTHKPTSLDEIKDVIRKASQAELKGILDYTEEELVSSDFIGNTHSCIYDHGASIALNKSFFKLVAWYDNEIGYSARIVDLLHYLSIQESA